MSKPKIATVFLAGCFGCHMSVLDIDERLMELAEVVDFSKSPLTDEKLFSTHCRVGLIEGGCATEENVHIVRQLRKNCDLIVSVGECALQGDVPSMRNTIPLQECLDEAYFKGPTVYNPLRLIPNDPELPLLLNRVYPCHEVIKIDYFIPGCPARSDAIWEVLTALLSNKPIRISYSQFKYD